MSISPRVPRPGLGTIEDVGKALQKQVDAVREIQKREIVDGFLLRDVELSPFGVPFVVRHGLKRSPNYLVTRRNAPAEVYDTPANDQNSELWLLSSAPVTVNLWIF